MTTEKKIKKKANKNKSAKIRRKYEALKNAEGQKNVDIGGQFTLIKDVIPRKPKKIERVLPDWLSNPILIRKSLQGELKTPKEVCPILHPSLFNCLKKKNIATLFPVQEALIPHILSGCHGLENRYINCQIFFLFSLYVYDVFNIFSKSFNLKIGKAFGDENFINEQKQLVTKIFSSQPLDVFLDHITNTIGLDFTQLRFLVFDEADKLLAGDNGELIKRIQGHIMKFKHKDINNGIPPFLPLEKKVDKEESQSPETSDPLILNENKRYSLFSRPFKRKLVELEPEEENDKTEYFYVPHPPVQRLLFSATLTHDPEQLQNVSLFNPILFTSGGVEEEHVNTEIDELTRPSELSEEFVKTNTSLKLLVLHYVLQKERRKTENFQALVFAGSLELTSKITVLLKTMSKDKYVVEEFSSKFAKKRKTRLMEFLKGNIHVLVSSDAMARGIDVPNVDCVISYDVPSSSTYTHRVGRTARAGKPGKAISIVTEDELKVLKRILGKNFTNVSERVISEEKLEKFEDRFRKALGALSDALKQHNQNGKIIKNTLKRKTFKKKKNVNNKS
ncbi:ATP-dependent RNA helicase DDX51 [Armadillidium nasatum]|uniref:ATP-dependent RNA helicase n=1 Tax=Armadillidium nasatum TaxID=96803 RepID=A0A5N5TPX5_9CRUS|nr:ATP-dependent RNA helicase DDX51 [Armadillidium nasatum]